MKKALKFVVTVLAVALFAATAFGCSSVQSTEGKYSYSVPAWYTTYGCKVRVYVSGNTIKDVVVLQDYAMHQVTDNWNGKEAYIQNEAGLLKKYVGMKIDEVMAITVLVSDGTVQNNGETMPEGTPYKIANYPVDHPVFVTGATQSSGRLILAVQNALENLSAKAE